MKLFKSLVGLLVVVLAALPQLLLGGMLIWLGATCFFGSDDVTEERPGYSVRGPNRITAPTIGCASKEAMDRVATLMLQNDGEALAKFVEPAIILGLCTQFKRGEVVYYMDSALLDGLLQVRRKGEVDGHWTYRERIIDATHDAAPSGP